MKLSKLEFKEWGKFYPKRVIQIGGVELSTPISHVKKFIQKSYPKKILSKEIPGLSPC